MNILYYDCFAGISGDMNLGAMLDLGIKESYLTAELDKLGVDGYTLEVSRDQRRGIEGTRVQVNLTSHKHTHDHDHGHHHHHRNLSDIKTIIDNSTLPEAVKKISKDIFTKLAHAEAKVHGKPVDQVHFHEVGAVDSIVDIVGAAICYDALNIDKVICSPIELGSGLINCAHGTFPVPAPATAELLTNIPTQMGTVPFEATTPTGAALMATMASEFTNKKQFTIAKIGYGIGYKDSEVPNVLRVFIGETKDDAFSSKDLATETAWIMECNIDDMNPELYEHIIEKLLNNGADDVYVTPIQMKKSRPAITLSVLYHKNHEEGLVETLFQDTTTLGLRRYKVDKLMLKRETVSIDTRYGAVSVKSAFFKGKQIKSKPEYRDCKAIAEKNNISIQDVYKEVFSQMHKDLT